MNRLLFATGLVAFLGFILFFTLTRETARDHGRMIPIALGNPTPTSIDLHLAVAMGMPRIDGPKIKNNVIQWDLWVEEHFEIRDTSGTRVPMRRSNFSRLIPEPTAGTPEFFLFATLKPGKTYTVDYIAVAGGSLRYRYQLTAPAAANEPQRVNFEPVE